MQTTIIKQQRKREKNGGPRDPTTGRLSERRREPARVMHAEVPARAAGPGRRAGGCQRFALDDPGAPATGTAHDRKISFRDGGRRFAANRFCTNSPRRARLVVKIERWDCEAKAVDVETHDSGDSAQCERVEPQNPRVAHPSSGRLYCTAARLAGGRSEPCLTGPLGQRLAHSDAAAPRATRTRKRSGRRQRSL